MDIKLYTALILNYNAVCSTKILKAVLAFSANTRVIFSKNALLSKVAHFDAQSAHPMAAFGRYNHLIYTQSQNKPNGHISVFFQHFISLLSCFMIFIRFIYFRTIIYSPHVGFLFRLGSVFAKIASFLCINKEVNCHIG